MKYITHIQHCSQGHGHFKDRSLEKYHIYLLSKEDLHMNQTYIDIHNRIFVAMYGFDDEKHHTVSSIIYIEN
jgi:hypothetical protein